MANSFLSNETPKPHWFEFLLNPSLLEIHLIKERPEPTATELIIQFLANAHSSPAPIEPSVNGAAGGVNSEGALSKDLDVETKKKQALKLLALKVAAFLKWNLTILEQKLPLPMQQTILQDLQKVVTQLGEANTSQDALFAQILYHRWILRVLTIHSYPSKGPKGINVQLPCQSDPTFVPPDTLETIKKKVEEQLIPSAQFLEDVLNRLQDGGGAVVSVRMPTLACIDIIQETRLQPLHDWTRGISLQPSEVSCQVNYDLGCYYFFQQEYTKAYEHFKNVSQLLSQLTSIDYCTLNNDRFEGYLKACTYILGLQSTSLNSTLSLEEKLERSCAVGAYKEIIQLLLEDNLKKEIPLILRSQVEMDLLQQGERLMETYHQVVVLNAVRKVIQGVPVMSSHFFSKNLIYSNRSQDKLIYLLIEALNAVLPGLTHQQKTYIKNYISLLCEQHEFLKTKLLSSSLVDSLFTENEKAQFKSNKGQIPQTTAIGVLTNFTSDPKVELATLERRLLAAIDPSLICDLVHRLKGYLHKLSSSQWDLPPFIVGMVRSLPPSADQEYMHFLLAKAMQLSLVKKYKETLSLFHHMQEKIESGFPGGGSGTRLGRYVSGKILEAELNDASQYSLNARSPNPDILLHHVRSYLISPPGQSNLERDHQIVELACAWIFNMHNWDIFNEMDYKNEPYMQLNFLLASTCRDLYTNSGRRSSFRELWEAVIPMFCQNNGGGHKRTNSGVIKDSRALVSRHQFLSLTLKLTDTFALGIIIALLAKLFNILKDDPSKDIFHEYQTFWPSLVGNASLYKIENVQEFLSSILTHSLSIHPTHASWLRTNGDMNFSQGHYAYALKEYISAGAIITDYFNQPFPRSLMDDAFFKRMIQCCTKLHNYTQAAVLSQCLDEPNYSLTFKVLRERGCSDSCDALYSCVWDMGLLEFLIHSHARRGEAHRRRCALRLAGTLDLNTHNNEEIQREAAALRRAKFFCALARCYL